MLFRCVVLSNTLIFRDYLTVTIRSIEKYTNTQVTFYYPDTITDIPFFYTNQKPSPQTSISCFASPNRQKKHILFDKTFFIVDFIFNNEDAISVAKKLGKLFPCVPVILFFPYQKCDYYCFLQNLPHNVIYVLDKDSGLRRWSSFFFYFLGNTNNVFPREIRIKTLFAAEDILQNEPFLRVLQKVFNSYSSFSQREAEVFHLCGFGLNNKEMAEHLHITPSTVKKHLYNINRKIGGIERLKLVSASNLYFTLFGTYVNKNMFTRTAQ
jgi:DNA-binding CsgD family transcriptional regulator